MQLSLQLIGTPLILCGLITSAGAAIISYEIVPNGGNNYSYTYTVYNDSPADAINDISIYFPDVSSSDASLYKNITAVTTPSGWTPLVAEPSSTLLNLGGYVDWSSEGEGIVPGKSMGGFEVSFNYSGSGFPGRQAFEIFHFDVDGNVIDPAEPGITTPVPEPCTWFAGAFAMLFLAYRGMNHSPRISDC